MRRRWPLYRTIGVLLTAVFVAESRGQPTDLPRRAVSLPSTPAGREFGRWLAAFNSHQRAVYRDYIARRAPALTKYVQSDYDFALAVGRFTLVRVDEGSQFHLTGLLAEPYADFPTRFTIRLDSVAPHRVLALDLAPADRPPEMSPPALSDAALVRALEARLTKQSADHRFSGVVLLARGDQILFHRAYGFANRGTGQRNTIETRFHIGSMSKMITAVSVMQLVATKRLDLDARLGDILPSYPNRDLATTVTVQHLLTHTGGTGDIFVPEVEHASPPPRSHADYLRILGSRAPDAPPGVRFNYSNYGYVLLGRVIEAVSGENYFDYVRSHVYAPASMRHTGTALEARWTPSSATGYTRRSDSPRWQPVASGLPDVPTAAGGELSTAHDLYRFARALQSDVLLPPELVDTITTGHVDAPFGRYGYGFKDQRRGARRYVGHGGSAPGSNGELDIYPASGHIVVVLTNQDPPYGNRVADFIGHRLGEPDAPRQ